MLQQGNKRVLILYVTYVILLLSLLYYYYPSYTRNCVLPSCYSRSCLIFSLRFCFQFLFYFTSSMASYIYFIRDDASSHRLTTRLVLKYYTFTIVAALYDVTTLHYTIFIPFTADLLPMLGLFLKEDKHQSISRD